MTRIFMLSRNSMFSRGLESLLRQETGVEIVGRETDADRAVGRIKELRPDVVIVDNSQAVCDSAPLEMRILMAGNGTTVIGLNLRDNTVCIYRGEQRVVKEIEDLLEAFEPTPLSSNPGSSDGLVGSLTRRIGGGQNGTDCET